MLVAICGREGAGKSTIASFLAPNGPPEKQTGAYRDPLEHIVDIMFGLKSSTDAERDPIWNLDFKQACEIVMTIIRTYIDSDYQVSDLLAHQEFPVAVCQNQVQELSFADPLKKIAAIIFGFDYQMLLGLTPSAREQRETLLSRPFNIIGRVTGRKCLEYFGTEIWRQKFDNDVWIKIMKRNALALMKAGKRVVIPDLRFPNEKEVLDELNGSLIVVYKDPNDLLLTQEDQKTHPAKWKFLTLLYKGAKNMIYIHNNGTLEDLRNKLEKADVWNYAKGETLCF